MKRLLTSLIRFFDALTEPIGKGISWACLLLILTVCFDVFLRYCFHLSFVATRELEWHLFALLFLLGASYTLKHDEHVRVDLFYQKLSPRGRAYVNVIGTLFFLLPGCFLVVRTSLPFFIQSWQIHEGSPDPGGLPARYILKAAIPLGFFLLSLQGISFLCRNLLCCMGVSLEDKE